MGGGDKKRYLNGAVAVAATEKVLRFGADFPAINSSYSTVKVNRAA
jgi:hypothetical protein